jgi:hypothetical protein
MFRKITGRPGWSADNSELGPAPAQERLGSGVRCRLRGRVASLMTKSVFSPPRQGLAAWRDPQRAGASSPMARRQLCVFILFQAQFKFIVESEDVFALRPCVLS